MQDYRQLEQKDLEREYESVAFAVKENHKAKALSKIGKFMTAYSLAAGIAITGLVSYNAPAEMPEAPQMSTAQVTASPSRTQSNGLAAIFFGAGGMALICGTLVSTRRVGIMLGDVLDDENLAVLEQRHAALKSEVDCRRRRNIGVMIQAEMKLS